MVILGARPLGNLPAARATRCFIRLMVLVLPAEKWMSTCLMAAVAVSSLGLGFVSLGLGLALAMFGLCSLRVLGFAHEYFGALTHKEFFTFIQLSAEFLFPLDPPT